MIALQDQLSMVSVETLKSKIIVTFRTEPFSAGVVCIGGRESSESGTSFPLNTALGRKQIYIRRTYMG